MAIAATLKLGQGSPRAAPRELMESLLAIEVRQADMAPSGFQLTFGTDRNAAGTSLALLADHFGEPFTRVVIGIDVSDGDGAKEAASGVLIDGFVTLQEVVGDDEGMRLVLTGEDASVKMDMVALSTEYPAMNDAAIVRQILGRYSRYVSSRVESPSVDPTPSSYVQQQNATDLAYLRRLAARHGFVFSIVAGGGGTPVAYWGPPEALPACGPALTVGAGAESNVRRVRFRYDALAPTVAYGSILDTAVQPPATRSVAIGSPSRDLGYAKRSAFGSGAGLAGDPASFASDLGALSLRGSLFRHQGLDLARATGVAQAMTDASSDGIVRVEGELDTFDYGAFLSAPGMVELRGGGEAYDGKYYVSEAVHRIAFADRASSYRQEFALTRAGLGTTVTTVEA